MIVRLHWQANFILRNLGCFENFVKFQPLPWESGAKQLVICMVSAFYLHDQQVESTGNFDYKEAKNIEQCRIAGCAVGALHADT